MRSHPGVMPAKAASVIATRIAGVSGAPDLSQSTGSPDQVGDDTEDMTDTRAPSPPSSSARGRSPPARRWSARISSATPRSSCSARRRCCSCRPAGEPRRVRRAWRRHPRFGRSRRRPRRHRRRRRQGRGDRRQGRKHACSRPMPSSAGSITSRSARTARSPGRRQDGLRAHGKGSARMLEVPSTVGGLAFAPKGFRLAIAHYNGVTLWFPNAPRRARAARMEGLASRRDA